LLPPELLKKGISGQHQYDMVVPPAPGATLEVIESQFIFQLAVTVLNPPTAFGSRHQPLERRSRGEVAEEVLGGMLDIGRPLDEEPARL
jgi:hypothetical protein